MERMFMPWFKDFAPSADSWRNTLADGGGERSVLNTHACRGNKMGKEVFICVLLQVVADSG